MTYKRKHRPRNSSNKTTWRTRNRAKDLDEVDEDIQPDKIKKVLNQEIDLDKPGCGQFYCIHCARYFIDQGALKEHFRSKGHKRRIKDLEVEPYSVEESERAGGLGNYRSPKKRKVETQPLNEMDVIKEEVLEE